MTATDVLGPEPGRSAHCERPFFIIGTERSGSNLLRLILNTHPHLLVPHPPHVLRYFTPLAARYGDLELDRPFEHLVDDVLRLVETHIHKWDTLPDRARVLAEAPSRTVFGVFAAIYEQAREASGKPRWGCKSTFIIDHVDTVLVHYPRAQFIHLVRDPRDVALSSKSSVFNPYHPLLTAELWRRQQAMGVVLRSRLSEDVMTVVKYEDLVSRPEETVRRTCAFLGAPYDPELLRFFTTPDAQLSASLSASWRNTNKPILRDNVGKYRTGLTPREVRQVEGATEPELGSMGYRRDWPSGTAGGGPARVSLWLVELALRVRGELRSLIRDANHWRRWRRSALMAAIGLRRALYAAAGKWRRWPRSESTTRRSAGT